MPSQTPSIISTHRPTNIPSNNLTSYPSSILILRPKNNSSDSPSGSPTLSVFLFSRLYNVTCIESILLFDVEFALLLAFQDLSDSIAYNIMAVKLMNEDAVCEKGDRVYGRFRNLKEDPITIVRFDIIASGEEDVLDNTSLLFDVETYVHGDGNAVIYDNHAKVIPQMSSFEITEVPSFFPSQNSRCLLSASNQHRYDNKRVHMQY